MIPELNWCNDLHSLKNSWPSFLDTLCYLRAKWILKKGFPLGWKCSSPCVQRGSNGNEGGGESGETCVCVPLEEGGAGGRLG